MFDLTTLKKNDLKQALANATQKVQQPDRPPLLLYKSGLLKDGWLLGQEAMPVGGKTIVLLSASITKGWIAFEKEPPKRFVGETSKVIWSNEKPEELQIPNPESVAVNPQTSALVKVEGLEIQAEMKGSTVGFNQAFDTLIPQIVMRLDEGHLDFCNPRLRLDTDSYKHKEYGLKGVPVLTLLGWCNADGELEDKPKQVAADYV